MFVNSSNVAQKYKMQSKTNVKITPNISSNICPSAEILIAIIVSIKLDMLMVLYQQFQN